MSAIFKARKIPKHLIISAEPASERKRRVNPTRLLAWLVVLLFLGAVLLQFR